MVAYIKNLFEQQEEDYYKPVGVGNFYGNSFIEYESQVDRNKTLSIKEYLYEFKPYLKDITNNLWKYDTWKIQLTTIINFISFKNTEEKRVTHSKSDNLEIMINDKADEVIKGLSESLLNRCQIRLETSTRGIDFIFAVLIIYIANVLK